MRKMIYDHDERQVIHKNRLINRNDRVKGNRSIVKSGFDLYQDGSQVFIHTHDHKDLDNKAKAVLRQLSSRQKFSHPCLAMFDAVTSRYMKFLKDKLDKDPMKTDTHSVFDYVSKQSAWS